MDFSVNLSNIKIGFVNEIFLKIHTTPLERWYKSVKKPSKKQGAFALKTFLLGESSINLSV